MRVGCMLFRGMGIGAVTALHDMAGGGVAASIEAALHCTVVKSTTTKKAGA